MAKKRKAKKAKIKSKRTTKKNDPKKRSSRKPVLRAVATSEKEEAEVPQARTPHDIFEGIKGRRPKSDQELNEWLASPEGKASMAFEPTSLSRWGKRDGHRIRGPSLRKPIRCFDQAAARAAAHSFPAPEP